jgi:hypothetical protein
VQGNLFNPAKAHRDRFRKKLVGVRSCYFFEISVISNCL